MGRSVDASQAAEWLDDLFWHRKMYHGAQFRWWGEKVMNTLLTYTNGRLDFDTLDDLRRIHAAHEQAVAAGDDVLRTVGDRLVDAAAGIGWDYDRLGEAIGTTANHCSQARALAGRGEPTDPDVRLILDTLARNPFTNPLIEAMELLQLVRLYEAVAGMLDDTLCDLVVELRRTRPAFVLCDILQARTIDQVDARVTRARDERGEPGDPRRIPLQRPQHV